MISAVMSWLGLAKKPEDTPAMGHERSSEWTRVRGQFLAKNNRCAACGTKDNLNAHHIVPFHLDRSKELEESNLIALCRDDHLTFGHLKCWSSYNKDVIKDAEKYLEKVKNRP